MTQRFILRVLVDAPTPFQEVMLPLRITGQARTFEANVRLTIRDSKGNTVVDTFTTAHLPDVGKFGPYEFIIPPATLAPYRNTQVTLELFEASAKDGSPLGVVTVPVRLR